MVQLAVFPIFTSSLMAVALVVTYIIAVKQKNVSPIWPYISDDARNGLYPESNIFAQLLCMASMIGMCTIFIRYKVTRYHIGSLEENTVIHRVSIAAVVFGELATFGLTLVGTFQENLPDRLHFVGASMMFGLGTVYALLDSYVTCRIRPWSKLVVLRIVIATTSIIFIVLFAIGKQVSEDQWKSHYIEMTTPHTMHHWNKTDPGYPVHILGSVSEWVLGVMFLLYFTTFVNEFRAYSLEIDINAIDPDPNSMPVLIGHQRRDTVDTATRQPTESTYLMA